MKMNATREHVSIKNFSKQQQPQGIFTSRISIHIVVFLY